MNKSKTIAPRQCESFESALNTAKLLSHHDGFGIEPQYMYVIQRDGKFWVDSSQCINERERLICSVFHRHTRPVVDKIVMHELRNGFFVKHPDNGYIYAIFQSRKLIANTEHVIVHFDPARFNQLKHGNPNAGWPRWDHVNKWVKDRIKDYNRNFGLYETTTFKSPI